MLESIIISNTSSLLPRIEIITSNEQCFLYPLIALLQNDPHWQNFAFIRYYLINSLDFIVYVNIFYNVFQFPLVIHLIFFQKLTHNERIDTYLLLYFDN